VARLKLLLIVRFMTLHILNLITPLAPNYGHGHSHVTSDSGIQEGGAVGVRRVDIMEKHFGCVGASCRRGCSSCFCG
jgi:hydroxymethylglutaryl-CoA reductase (NADPH)